MDVHSQEPALDAARIDPEIETAASQPNHVAIGSLMAALSVALSACGGGGTGGGGGSLGGGSSVTPPVITISDTEAARFALQAQFSVNDADITAIKASGYSAWLDAQFASTPGQTGWAWLDSRGYNAIGPDETYFNPTPGDFMIWNQLMAGPDQVRKRLALALSEMFVVSLDPIDGFWPYYMIAGYWDMLTANVFGNFRTLIEEVTLNPAMGFFLNTKGNLKEDVSKGRQPDENYAREVMQLMTIGLYQLNTDGSYKLDGGGNKIETYGQGDITNLAHVFTGYDYDMSQVTQTPVTWEPYPIPTNQFAKGHMAFTASKHSTLAVTFLGTTIPANTDGATALKTALDTLFNHANTGPFFARQMIQRLVTSNPSAAYIGRVAAVFNDNGSGVRGDLKAVWKAILTDAEARTLPTGTTAGKLREPMIRLIQFARTTGMTSSTGKWEIYDQTSDATGFGQSPLRSSSVFNFFRPGYVPPDTALASAGLTAPEFQIVNETTVAGYLNSLMNFVSGGYNDVQPTYADQLALVTDSAGLLAALNLHLTANQLSATSLATIKTALDATTVTATSSDALKLSRVKMAVYLVMACPEYLVQK